MKAFLHDSDGSTAVEYALVGALLLLVAYVGLSAAGLGASIGHASAAISEAMTAAGVY